MAQIEMLARLRAGFQELEPDGLCGRDSGSAMSTGRLPDIARAFECEHQAAQVAARLAAERAVAWGRLLAEEGGNAA